MEAPELAETQDFAFVAVKHELPEYSEDDGMAASQVFESLPTKKEHCEDILKPDEPKAEQTDEGMEVKWDYSALVKDEDIQDESIHELIPKNELVTSPTGRGFTETHSGKMIDIALATVSIAIAVLVKTRRERQRRNKRCWVRPWLRREEGEDVYSMLMKGIRPEDTTEFQNFMRMDVACFDKLLSLIGRQIFRRDTVMRQSISPNRRLAVTLRFLATGESYKSLAFSHRISVSSISNIVMEVCSAICSSLRETYLKAPSTEREWLQISKEFEDLWHFPNCLGAMGGKHIAFAPPQSPGQKLNSMVLLAVVDAHYRFTLVDIGCSGRENDGFVFGTSKINTALKENWLHVPGQKVLKDSNISLGHVIVADDAFRLEPHVMKPYKDCKNDNSKKVYNYRLSRARHVVDNAFGILANRFRILFHTIMLPIEKVEMVIETLCILHNFLIREADSTYLSIVDREDTDQCTMEEGLWRTDVSLPSLNQQGGNRTSLNAREVRDKFCEYFNTIGRVPWQWESIKKFNF